jgi:hypothetical protein
MTIFARGLVAALFLSLCLTSAFAAAADDALGSISYLEGQVSLVRDGQEVDSVAIGSEVQNFDVITTGADGIAELAIPAGRLPAMTVKISPDTQFSLELAASGQRQQTTLGIVGGSLSVKAARLTASQDLQVKTDFAAMGVRGTDFVVTAPATGDVLVTCDEGDVVCTDDQGKKLHAIPGSVVEKRQGELFRTVAVEVTGLPDFRARWSAERVQTMEQNALRLIQANALLYARLSRELNEADAALRRNEAVIAKWTTEDRAGRIGTRAELLRERRVIQAELARLRQIVFRLERVSFRLARLKVLNDRGFGQGTLSSGLTTTQFFAQVEAERADVARKLAFTRYVAKMYVKRNEGRLP